MDNHDIINVDNLSVNNFINMNNNQIKNLQNGNEDNDAANIKQLNENESNIVKYIQREMKTLKNEITNQITNAVESASRIIFSRTLELIDLRKTFPSFPISDASIFLYDLNFFKRDDKSYILKGDLSKKYINNEYFGIDVQNLTIKKAGQYTVKVLLFHKNSSPNVLQFYPIGQIDPKHIIIPVSSSSYSKLEGEVRLTISRSINYLISTSSGEELSLNKLDQSYIYIEKNS